MSHADHDTFDAVPVNVQKNHPSNYFNWDLSGLDTEKKDSSDTVKGFVTGLFLGAIMTPIRVIQHHNGTRGNNELHLHEDTGLYLGTVVQGLVGIAVALS